MYGCEIVCPLAIGKAQSSYARDRSSAATNSWRGTASIAASTARSSIPRRRNCFSIISARCEAWSLRSSMRHRFGVPFPGAGFQDFVHLGEGKVALVFAIVKMRRDAHSGLGAIVDEDVAGKKFAANFVSMWAFDGDGSGALRRIFGSINFPTAELRAVDKTRGQVQRFLANGADADLIKNFQTRLTGVESGNVRRAVEVAERVFARIDGARLKRKRAAMRHPAGERWFQLSAQIFTDIEVCDAGSTAQPLEHATDREISAEAAHVHRNCACGLEGVEDNVCAYAVRALDDGARVDNVGAAKQHHRNRHKQGGFIDGSKEFL